MHIFSKGTLFPALVMGLITTSAAAHPAPVPQVEWDTTINKFQLDNDKFIGQRFAFECPRIPNKADNSGVYGTDIYPSKSSICVAALHAGAMSADGGVVTLQLNPGAENYTGSARNSVKTESLPGTQRSIAFMVDVNKAMNDKVRADYIPRIKWDTKFTRTGLANMKLIGQEFSFECPAAPANLRPRRVVGTDTYEFGSVICLSAVHAGMLTESGGVVTLRMDDGERKPLVGSIRNGIESHDGPGGPRAVRFISSNY